MPLLWMKQPWEDQNGLRSEGSRVCGTPNARVFPCLDVMLGQRAKAHSSRLTGETEKAGRFLSLLGAAVMSTRACEVSGSLTQENAALRTCAASPSIAAHMRHVVWVLLAVFGGTHVFTALSVDCYLKIKK